MAAHLACAGKAKARRVNNLLDDGRGIAASVAIFLGVGATMNGRIVTERLLATTSLVALMLATVSGEASATVCATVGNGASYDSGGSVSCVAVTGNAISVTNQAGGSIGASTLTPTSGAVAVHSGAGLSGGVTNSGTITGRTGGGVSVGVGAHGVIQGGITNASTITAGDKAIEIFADAPSFGGGISNSGTIQSNNTGVLVASSTFAGGITNSGGTIAGGNSGPAVSITSNEIDGSITNAGTITQTGFGVGIRIAGSGGASFNGSIVNNGTLGAFQTAVMVQGLTTFSGSIVNTAGHSIASHSCGAVLAQQISTFVGGITNAGTIAMGLSTSGGTAVFGIQVSHVGLFGGGITNTGSIVSTGSCGMAIAVGAVSSFGGGIVNAAGATLSTAQTAINVAGVSTFTGGISNAGTITASNSEGIFVSATSFIGGITNSGSISAGGDAVDVRNISTLAGGIVNAVGATLQSGSGLGILIDTVSAFSGGISNAGAIGSASSGVSIDAVSTFSGGIANGGTIVTPDSDGIGINNVSVFSGGISNSGTISGTAAFNIANISVFSGNISNSGIINASIAAIKIDNVSTLSGSIVNSGTIAGVAAIVLTNVSFAAGGGITNSGTIQGTGGTAIDLSAQTSGITIAQAGGTILGTILFSSHGDTLTGNGTIVGNVAQGNAIFAPTLGGIGALKFVGNLTQGASSNTIIEVSPTAAAQINVTGTAAVAGALKIVYDPGTYTFRTYDIVHAGAVSGTYATTTSSGQPSGTGQTIAYTSTDVNLILGAPASTVSTTTGAFGSASNIALSDGFFDVDGIVFDHMDDTQFGQGADQVKTALAGTAPMQLAMNGPLQQLAQAGGQMSDTLARHGAWVRGVGSFLDVDNQGAASGFSAQGGGVIAGIDHPFGPVTLGIAAGYSGTNFRQNDGESGDIQTIRGMAYVHYHAAPQIIVDGIAGIAYDRIHTQRPIASLGSTASESHNAWEENLAVQAGYVMPWQGFTLIPRIGAQYLHLAENKFSESGGSGFDLSRGAENVDSFQPLISLAALKPFVLANGMRVTPEFKVTYSHELLNPSETLALSTPTGSIVPASVVTPAHNTVTLGPSATLRLNDSVNLFADYKLAIGIGKSLDNVIAAGARFTW